MGMRPRPARRPAGLPGPTLIGTWNWSRRSAPNWIPFTIDANRVLAEGAVDQDEAAAVKDGEGVARVVPDTRVKPGDKLPFAVDIEDMYFFDTEPDLAIRTCQKKEKRDGRQSPDPRVRSGPGNAAELLAKPTRSAAWAASSTSVHRGIFGASGRAARSNRRPCPGRANRCLPPPGSRTADGQARRAWTPLVSDEQVALQLRRPGAAAQRCVRGTGRCRRAEAVALLLSSSSHPPPLLTPHAPARAGAPRAHDDSVFPVQAAGAPPGSFQHRDQG